MGVERGKERRGEKMAAGGGEIVPVSSGASAASRADDRWNARRLERPEKLREREATKGKNVWTKDPHGGRYRVSTGPLAAKGYDALEETPEGQSIVCEAGYEKPQRGPTSNFVGNHMTQGAIDLVQGSLTRRDPAHERRKLERYRQTYHPPKLVSRESSEKGDVGGALVAAPQRAKTPPEPVLGYRWWDSGAVVVVEAEVKERCSESGSAVENVQFSDRSFSAEAGGWVLSVPRLFSAILPAESTAVVLKGKVEGAAPRLSVRLAKADPSKEWPRISAPAQAALPSENSAKGPDLALLRRAIRQQRDGKKAGDGRLFADLDGVRAEMEAERDGGEAERRRAAMAAVGAELEGMTLPEAELHATDLVSAGDFASAAASLSFCLDRIVDNSDFAGRCRLLLHRSRCHREVGEDAKAVADLEECLGLGVSPLDAKAALGLARLSEQMEDFEAMAAHAERLASLDPSSPDVAGLRSRSRRGARLREEREERERAEGTGGGLLPSVPRKVPARFENRGKSGAVF